MDTITEEKLYRIVLKKGSHVNTKLNSDGSKAAIQFTDKDNALSGPVNLIEVDERELVTTGYIPVRDKPLTFKEIILQEVVTPLMRDVLYHAMIEGYDALCCQLKTKTVPEIKAKSKNLIRDARIIASGLKDGFAGKTPKALELVSDAVLVETPPQPLIMQEQEKIVRSKEEIENIVQVMRVSTAVLAACIRLLNDTVMADGGSDPQVRFEIQRNMQTLTSSDVMQQIDWLLEEKNKDLMDESAYLMLVAFKTGNFLVNNERIPFSRYID